MSEKIKALRFEKFKEIIHPKLVGMMKQRTTGDLVVDGSLPLDDNY